MRKSTCLLGIAILILLGSLTLTPWAEAYDAYQSSSGGDNCTECHPGFVAGVSGPLHQAHLVFTSSCTACHVFGSGSTPVPTHEDPPINGNVGCVGCHGNDPSTGAGDDWAAGLRLHHTNAGAPADSNGSTCVNCHGSDPLPLPEYALPLYYDNISISNLTDPCADNLDNDGDLAYDAADDDCPSLCMIDDDCDDGVSCTDDVCNVDTGECSNTANDALCDDGTFCNGDETCDAVDDCQPGTPVDCDDGVGCTTDSCNEGTDSCENVPDDAACDNGQFCDGDETCDAVDDCQPGTPPNCDDGVGCTDDSCDEVNDVCVNDPNDANCPDDGLFCNGAEFCDPVDDCSSMGDPCPPGEVCNEDTDICEPIGCTADTDCDDGVFCNGAETCNVSTGECVPGTPPDCDDGVGCTLDSCNESTDSCDNVPDDAACDNGQFCDGAEICDPALDCQPGTPPDCDDGVGCTDDSCDETADACVNDPNDANCPDDGLFCNGAEFCDPVDDCSSMGDPCPPGEVCNEDTDICEPIGCTADTDCDDGMFCNGAETCDVPTGECQPGTPVDCDDGVGCTLDSCNESTDSCDNVPDDAACDNGQFCDGAEICDPALDCQPGTPPDCDDGVGCTDDSCDEVNDVCVNDPNDANCPDDGLFCNGAEFCDPQLDCSSTGDPCPPDTTCDEDTDICEPVVGGVDLDIFKFQASRRVLVANPDPPGQVVKIKLWVYNAGEVDEPRAATVVGMQDTTVVYSETMMVSDRIDGEPTLYKFPSYDPERVGTIYWTATIADDDPDVDEATAMTRAR